jgi:hypothetical protein
MTWRNNRNVVINEMTKNERRHQQKTPHMALLYLGSARMAWHNNSSAA